MHCTTCETDLRGQALQTCETDLRGQALHGPIVSAPCVTACLGLSKSG